MESYHSNRNKNKMQRQRVFEQRRHCKIKRCLRSFDCGTQCRCRRHWSRYFGTTLRWINVIWNRCREDPTNPLLRTKHDETMVYSSNVILSKCPLCHDFCGCPLRHSDDFSSQLFFLCVSVSLSLVVNSVGPFLFLSTHIKPMVIRPTMMFLIESNLRRNFSFQIDRPTAL